jgi:hypothetical protein
VCEANRSRREGAKVDKAKRKREGGKKVENEKHDTDTKKKRLHQITREKKM